MKKIIYLFLILIFSILSCSKDAAPESRKAVEKQPVQLKTEEVKAPEKKEENPAEPKKEKTPEEKLKEAKWKNSF